MAKPTVTAIGQRPDVNTNIQSPGLEVTASPVNTVANNADALASKFSNLADSMSVFTQGFDQLAQKQTKAMIEKEQQQALKDEATQYNPDKQPVYTTDQTPWYTEARVGLWAERKGTELAGQMLSDLEKLKETPEFATTDINKWTQSYVDKSLQGLNDPTAIKGILDKVTKTQLHLNLTVPKEQEIKRHKQMIEDASASIENSLISNEFNPKLLEQQILDSKAKGLSIKDLVPAYVSAVRYGMAKGNYAASTLLDAPLNVLNGLSLRMVADQKVKDDIDSLVGKATPKLLESRVQGLSEDASRIFRDQGINEQSISQVMSYSLKNGLKRTEAAAIVQEQIQGAYAQTGDTEVLKLLNKPMATLDGLTLRDAVSSADRNKSDDLTQKVIAEQKKQVEEYRVQQAYMVKAGLEEALMKEDHGNLPINDPEAWAKMTFGNPALTKNPAMAAELYLMGAKKRFESEGSSILQAQYNSGILGANAFAKAEDKNKAQLAVEKSILKSGLSEGDQINQMVQLSIKNNAPSPYLKAQLDGISSMDATVKINGVDQLNPRFAQAFQVLNAIRKSANPQALSMYAQGENLQFLNSLDIQVNSMGIPLEQAAKNAKLWMEPTRAKQINEMAFRTKDQAVDTVMGDFSNALDSGSQFLFGTTNIHNKDAIGATAAQWYPHYLIAAGGNVDAATKALTTDLKARIVGVTSSKDAFSRDEGYAIMLPAGRTADPMVAKAFQAIHDRYAKQYPNESIVLSLESETRSSNGGGDAMYSIHRGIYTVGQITLSEIMATQKKDYDIKAYEQSLLGKNLSKPGKELAAGKITLAEYNQKTSKQAEQELQQLKDLMATNEKIGTSIEGNPNGPVLKGTGPTYASNIALQYVKDNPGFAIGVMSEGIPKGGIYRDNDGGVTIGLGYNTKHQTPEQMVKDFQKAGILVSPQSVIEGKVALTVPQMFDLHRVTFARYQEQAKKTFEGLYPGAWNNLNVYQQAAIGQLAYNTGWASNVMKDFLTKVGQGQEEKALTDLKVTWRDQAGNVHVNTDLMRYVRAMWQGPDVFSKVVSMGR